MPKIPKYMLFKQELDDDLRRYNEKRVLLQKMCPHPNLQQKSYCDDDYASFSNRVYTTYYTCPICGICASHSSGGGCTEAKSELFKKLDKIYDKQRYGYLYKKVEKD